MNTAALLTPRHAVPATVGWLPWTVHPRAHGYHVSRESAGGTQREFLRNSVGQVTIFRSSQRAAEACARANGAAA